jgi:hypothetical protein
VQQQLVLEDTRLVIENARGNRNFADTIYVTYEFSSYCSILLSNMSRAELFKYTFFIEDRPHSTFFHTVSRLSHLGDTRLGIAATAAVRHLHHPLKQSLCRTFARTTHKKRSIRSVTLRSKAGLPFVLPKNNRNSPTTHLP